MTEESPSKKNNFVHDDVSTKRNKEKGKKRATKIILSTNPQKHKWKSEDVDKKEKILPKKFKPGKKIK